jgi:ABC-type dipeptide/oligopeptide/nickel transport system permease component
VLQYAIRRLLQAIPVLFGVSILVFSMLLLIPGDPVALMLSENSAVSKEAVDRKRAELGLDDPIYVQYWRFLESVVTFDLGTSIQTNRPVGEMIGDVYPKTLQLTLAATSLTFIIGVPLGMLSAAKPRSWIDSLCMLIANLGVSMPIFWLGLIMIYVFSIKLGWVPVTTQGGSGFRHLILPAFALALGGAGIVARLTRSSLLEVLNLEYITTARAKGLTNRRVVIGHAMRNALIPVITIVGLQFGALLGGAVIVETVFARQGIGSMAVAAIQRKDFPLVQGTVLVAACSYVLANVLVDISYALIDPRIKYGD